MATFGSSILYFSNPTKNKTFRVSSVPFFHVGNSCSCSLPRDGMRVTECRKKHSAFVAEAQKAVIIEIKEHRDVPKTGGSLA